MLRLLVIHYHLLASFAVLVAFGVVVAEIATRLGGA